MASHVRLVLMTAFWLLAVVLMVIWSVNNEDPATYPIAGWACLCALLGQTFTGWHILASLLIKERARVEAVAEHAAGVAIQTAGLDSIGPV